MIEISGDYLEGGGAILRVASALSAVTGNPIHVFNIRKGRKTPGLRAQHMEGIKAVSQLCNGKLKGAEIGSEEIFFYPGKIENKELNIPISTAGSAALVFQILKLPASQSDKEIQININGGASFGKFAPPLVYTKNILLPILSKLGYKAEINILKHGFYPVGGARVNINVKPCKKFKALNLTERGDIREIQGISIASRHLEKAKVAERQTKQASGILRKSGFEPEIKTEYVNSLCPGSGIVLWAKTSKGCILGSDGLGERGKPAEKVGEEAAELLKKQLDSQACLDRWMADQILPYLALAGNSEVTVAEITNHCLTNIWVIEKFLPVKFEVAGEKGKPGRISVKKL